MQKELLVNRSVGSPKILKKVVRYLVAGNSTGACSLYLFAGWRAGEDGFSFFHLTKSSDCESGELARPHLHPDGLSRDVVG